MNSVTVLCAGIIALGIGGGGSQSRGEYACELVPNIIKYAEENNLRPELVIAVIHVESRFNPSAKSHAGACGLLQVLPRFTGRSTWGRKYACRELKDPETAIRVGTHLLNFWVNRYGKGNEKIGTCGYNSGFRCRGEAWKYNRKGRSYAIKSTRLANRLSEFVKNYRYD